MNLGFPTIFLKKLDIYQKIRSGQGISKHKKLWKYEAAFLKTAYNKNQQHLNSRTTVENFKKWIKLDSKEYDEKEAESITNTTRKLFQKNNDGF